MNIRRIQALGCWQGDISAEPLLGGLSNESWKVRDDSGLHVVRFGSDYPFHHVSREREIMIARAAHKAGFAPKVEHAQAGVMVSQFLNATTWDGADMRAAPERVGALLHRFHHEMPRHVSGPGFMFWVFHVVRDYARTIAQTDSSFVSEIPALLMLSDEMEAAQVPLPIIFGHHDLLAANILEDDHRLWFIDFEYAGFGTAMFDLAGAASNSCMSDDEATRLLNAYFGQEPDVAMRRAFDAMQCASLLREAMWAMVSEQLLDAPGANYADYARENLARLWATLENYRSKYGKPAS